MPYIDTNNSKTTMDNINESPMAILSLHNTSSILHSALMLIYVYKFYYASKIKLILINAYVYVLCNGLKCVHA